MWQRRIIVGSVLVISLVVIGILKQKDKIVICDVGQGNGAILISGNIQVLVDTGPAGGKMLECLEKYLPMWDKKIEAIIISHGDSDHSGGLPEIEKYFTIEQVYYSDEIRKNDIFRFGKYEIVVVWPEKISGDSNADSIVLKVNFKDKLYWFMGDVTAEVEEFLSWRNLWNGSGGILVVAHHGSKSATTKEMLQAINPVEAIISVGKSNKFGHPDKDVIKRLEEKGVIVKRTDINGTIVYD